MNLRTITEPGLYRYVSDEDYRRIAAANQSSVKMTLRMPPAKVLWQLRFPRESEAFTFGSAFHHQILQQESFEETYFVGEKFDKRTKEGKEKDAAQKATAGDRIVITAEDYDQICRMEAAILRSDDAAAILRSPYRWGVEVCALWVDPNTGILCKARMDLVNYNQETGEVWIWDLKTTDDAGEYAIQKDLAKFGYHIQAHAYEQGILLAPRCEAMPHVTSVRFGWLMVEKGSPHLTRVVRGLGPASRAAAASDWDRAMGLWGAIAGMTVEDAEPAYPTLAQADLPRWALKESEAAADDDEDFPGI